MAIPKRTRRARPLDDEMPPVPVRSVRVEGGVRIRHELAIAGGAVVIHVHPGTGEWTARLREEA